MKVDGNTYFARCTRCEWSDTGIIHFLLDKADRHESVYSGHHVVIEDTQPIKAKS